MKKRVDLANPERLRAIRAAVVSALWSARGQPRRNLEAQLRLLDRALSSRTS